MNTTFPNGDVRNNNPSFTRDKKKGIGYLRGLEKISRKI